MSLVAFALERDFCLEQHAARIERWLQQHSGQTLGMRVGIDSGGPRANFPRKISKGNVRQNRCPLEETKRIEKLLEICNRKQR